MPTLTLAAAWKRIFGQLKVGRALEEKGVFRLSTQKIKDTVQKEPRLMCKWDSRGDRPDALRDVTILPVSRREYVLVKGDGYLSLPKPGPVRFHSPEKLRRYSTLSWEEGIGSESVAIDAASLASILSDFTGEDDLRLTIRGRSGSSSFDFLFDGTSRRHQISVSGATVEVDAGFEGECVWLLEAKARHVEDFIIRQLYYPWRLWESRVKKKVRPVFFTYSNRVFGLSEYAFRERNQYHSIRLVRSAYYSLDRPKEVPALETLFDGVARARPGTAVFPQADTLATVIAAVEFYADGPSRASALADRVGFDPRQGQYYTTAGMWLGLLRREGGAVALTDAGARFVRADRFDRFRILFACVASTPVFREAVASRLRGTPLSEERIAGLIRSHGYASRSTPPRRAKTVVAWADWLWEEHKRMSGEAAQ